MKKRNLRRHSIWTLALSIFVVADGASAQAVSKPAGLDPAIVAKIDALLTQLADKNASVDSTDAARDLIWRRCAIRHGGFGPLFRDLAARRATKLPRSQDLRLIRVHAHYLRRLGDLNDARRMLDKIEIAEETVADALAKADVLDALGSDDAALLAYDRLLAKKLAPALQNRILLRKALIGGKAKPAAPAARPGQRPLKPIRTIRRAKALPLRPGTKAKPVARSVAKPVAKLVAKPQSPLAKFASQPNLDRALKNQAAVILALTGEQKDAIRVFVPEGKDTARFRQEVRIAEWAIEGGVYKKAQESAWVAVRNAKLKRDRRYALTVLVEAYRRDKKLDVLIDRFAKSKDLDIQSRETWIDLLRERGKVDEALRLFRESKKGVFTADMRRELLEICREANKDGILEAAYKKLTVAEPRFLEWREGLARFYLERGRREDALDTWRTYLDITDDNRYRMAAAASLMSLGLDGLAIEFANVCMKTGARDRESALMFLFELHKDRGRHKEAAEALKELDRRASPRSGIRKELADAWARLGDKKKAVEILKKLFETLGDETTPDTRMKLALMLSEVGEEDKALDHWQSMLRKINSVPRRRYVEERLMAVASRLGKLAKIAIRLEKKLIAGTADDRDAGLLVRLYIQVNDPVSATEIIQEHMAKSGKKPIEVLTEKARVFQSCEDYYNYELVIQELMKVDPEGRPDYLRQLAMSNMERGQRREAREILAQLKAEEANSISDEFEAGVLALAGMRTQALEAYRRGIAKYPERIDTFLLLSNIQKQLGRHERSAGMFQHLAATAEKDDLFTIAIDGILNMRDGRANLGAPNRLVEWARRVVIERVAHRPNKLYLLRLVADLSDELNDTAMAIRALKTAVPVAGEQRTHILRELMTMTKNLSIPSHLRNRPAFSRINMGQNPQQDRPAHPDLLMFGRRILGQGELVPPQTYLELGSAFLNAGEVQNATKTFNQASQLPEFAELRRQFARAFEEAGYPKEAQRIYEQILSVDNGDAGLVTKVGELLEQTGRDDAALGLYKHGLDLLLGRSIFVKTGVKKAGDKPKVINPRLYMPGNRNTDDWQRHEVWLVQGLLATLTEESANTFLSDQRKVIATELARSAAERQDGRIAADAKLSHHTRLYRRVTLFRRVAAAFGDIEVVDELDGKLLAQFVKDNTLLEEAVRFRLNWGFVFSARRLIASSDRPENEQKRLRLLTGGTSAGETPGIVSAAEAAGLLLPMLVDGQDDAAKILLERLSLSTGDKSALEHMPMLVGAATYLRDADLTLTLCRHWLNLGIKQSPGTMYGTVESILRQGRRMLDKSQLRSLTEHLLTQVVENPDTFTVFLRRLPQLREKAGSDFLTRDQIEKLIKSRLDASDRYLFGIEDLFVLLAAEDRSPVLRSVWNRLPKSRRAYFLLRLVSVLDNEFEKGFSDFLAAGFKQALTESDDKRILGFQVDNLADSGKVNIGLRLQFVEAMVASGESGIRMQGGHAILLMKLGRKDEALAVFKKVLAATYPESGRTADPMARSVYHRLTRSLGKEHGDALIGAFDLLEKERKPSVAMTNNRLSLLRQIGRTENILEALEAAVKKHPKQASLRLQLTRELQTRGEKSKALAIQNKALSENEKDNALRARIVSAWRALRNPVRALALRTAGEPFQPKLPPVTAPAVVAAPAAKKKDRTPPATLVAVKKAFDAKDETAALHTFRRLWRRFSPIVPNPYGSIFYPRGLGAQLVWPSEKKKEKPKPKEPKEKVKRGRGGLPELFTRALTEKEKKRGRIRQPSRYHRGVDFADPNQKPEDIVPAQAVLTKTDAGRAEVMRQLRSMPHTDLGNVAARDIYVALAAASVVRDGREKVITDLLDREKAGKCGKVDYGMLSALLDDIGKSSPESIEQSLRGLTANLNPGDENQVRRLARLHARTGDPGKAATLYRWCALLSGVNRPPYFFYQGRDDLLDEVMKSLSGDERVQAVQDILTYQDPGEYNRDMHLTIVLQTWNDLLPPEKAIEKSRRTLGEVTNTEMLPLRMSCKLATRMHARAGELDAATRCLEFALCKLPAPANTRFPFYATQFERPGYASTTDIVLFFPKDMSGFKDPAGWLERAAAKIEEWRKADRLQERLPLQMLCVLALRLHDNGRTGVARGMVPTIRELAGVRPDDLLWAADVARTVGDPKTAGDIERKLFDAERLHVERVPEVVGRILAAEGADAVLLAGEKAAAYTLHPDLLDHLVQAATDAGKLERATHWKKVRADAEQAHKTLEEQDKKRKEEAERRAKEVKRLAEEAKNKRKK